MLKTLLKIMAVGAVAATVLVACAPSTPTPTPTLTPLPSTATPVPPTAAPTVAATTVPSGPDSLFPPITADEWQVGPANARVTIIEYSDFQCPFCQKIAPVLAQLAEKYPADVRIIFRHFPLPIHDKAVIAAEASEAAGAQGKFWEFHDLLFERQDEWSILPPVEFRTKLDEYAQATELNVEQFGADLDGGTFKAKVAAAFESASTIGGQGLPYTPFILINDQPLDGNTPQEFWVLEAIVKLELLKEHQFAKAEQVIDPLKQYMATLKTTKGDVVIELYAEKTPLTVNSFVFLAQQGWFDNVQFHRVLPGFVAQSGDPTGTGFGGPGYYVKNEILPELTFNSEGVVGMANSGPDTNGSQFFITYAAAPSLDGKYTVFGRVLKGMDVVQQLTPRDPAVDPSAPEGDKILTVIIEEK